MNVERFARFLLIRFTEEGSCACDVSAGNRRGVGTRQGGGEKRGTHLIGGDVPQRQVEQTGRQDEQEGKAHNKRIGRQLGATWRLDSLGSERTAQHRERSASGSGRPHHARRERRDEHGTRRRLKDDRRVGAKRRQQRGRGREERENQRGHRHASRREAEVVLSVISLRLFPSPNFLQTPS